MVNIRGFVEKHKTGVTFSVLVLVSLICLLVSTNAFVVEPKKVGLSVFSLTQSGISKLGTFVSRTINSINELKKLRTQFEEMQVQLSDYGQIERNIVELRLENEQLRRQLGFSEKIGYNHIPAEIIGKDPGNYFNTIMINKGRRDGVERNMPVIAFNDGFQGLVGKVVGVGATSSEVLPIFDNSCYVAARLQVARYEGLVSGNSYGDSKVIMRYVKKRARNEIRYGDLVITSGMQSIYPKGIYIGRVRSLSGKEYETTLELEIEPIIDFSKIEYVFVLDKEEQH